ncbi:MAG: hypothetical protein HDT39_00060 [Lachnospiraceae bacterium]|nr:hypothetical protein [Lachnospiraceae bacterium]
MLDKSYYEGYEGEGEVKIWSDENGMVVWDGFYDDKWEMRYPHIVLEELKKFNEKLLDTKDEEIIKKSKEVIEQLVFLINAAVKNERKIYVEYN